MIKYIMKRETSTETRKNRSTIMFKLYRRAFNYWYPGTDVLKLIIRTYGKIVDNGDFLIISEKALSIAYGDIYDESLVKDDILMHVISTILNRYIFALLLRRFFHERTIRLLMNTPPSFMAAHKKLALRYGGFLHFIKPLSEAGIDTKNLPYHYVALPLRNAQKIAETIHNAFLRKGKYVNVLIVDTDRSLKIKKLNGIILSTRRSYIKGVIDLGGIAYLLSKLLKGYVRIYPTPVAYSGVKIRLPFMLRLAKIAIKAMGEGFGKNAYDMLQFLGKKDFNEVTWADMMRIRHYPVILIKINKGN